jgi:hypothetical protein
VRHKESDDFGFVYDHDELMADKEGHYRFRQEGPGPGDSRPTRKPASKVWLMRRKLTTKKGWAVIGRKLRRRIWR